MHPILNVVVVSFHHKRGCEVEYSHPRLDGDGEGGLPPEWTHLPSLALPDGVHNCDSDTICFLLPSRTESGKCVFGISCYRQIDSKELLARPDDVTRGSVQKSVCVISRVPLFGALRSKLEVITQAYFEQRDFGKVEVLGQMYTNLCDIFDEQLSGEYYLSLVSHEISVQQLFIRFRHRALVLLKLILLEKKVLFYAPTGKLLGETMLSLISMFPNLLEEGLYYASCSLHTPSQDVIPVKLEMPEIPVREEGTEVVVEEHSRDRTSSDESETREEDVVVVEEDMRMDWTRDDPIKKKDGFGFPLSIFVEGAHFDPYLPIQSMDIIGKVRSCVIGATNALFATKRDLFDVIVRLDEDNGHVHNHVDFQRGALDRVTALTSADLRFADFVLKKVEEQVKSSTAEFDGSNEWCRIQMRNYLLGLAVTAKTDLQASVPHYGIQFVNEWRKTRNYKIWMMKPHDDLASVAPGHMFAEQLGVYDVYLRFEHTINGVEGASKVIGAVNTTGKNIGNSIGETGSRVKAKFTNWWKGRGQGEPVDKDAVEAREDENIEEDKVKSK